MKGDYNKALPYMETALKTNSKNPTLLCRAGLVYAKTNNKQKAKSLLKELTTKNSGIEESLKMEGVAILLTLESRSN